MSRQKFGFIKNISVSMAPLFLVIGLVGCNNSSGNNSDDTAGDTKLGEVTGLTATPGNGEITLNWNAVSGASSYNVYWENVAPTRSIFKVADCSGDRFEGVTGNSYTHTGLANGTPYKYGVTAVDGDGNEGECGGGEVTGTPTAGGGGSNNDKAGCNHPDATNYDPNVTVYVPGSCNWPAIAGACGTANGKTYLVGDTTYGADSFCVTGTPNPNPPLFPAPGFGVIWSCDGVNGGTNAACNAQRNRDMTPPVTTVAWAEVSKTDTSWTGSATINENGTGYCTAIVGMAAPTPAEVKADNNANKAGTGGSVAMTAGLSSVCVVTGLAPNTTYEFYFVAEDGIPNLQTAVSGPVTATTLAPTPPPGMVSVPAGCFMMGDNFRGGQPNELPLRQVCHSAFFIDATEVTQAAYTAWGGDTGHPGYAFPGATNPAELVDWFNASANCAAQGKRLPTEAEWEYAARNGGQVVRYGTGINTLTCGVPGVGTANCNIAVRSTTPVGSYAPNAIGLYDMSGNAFEWVNDWYGTFYYIGRPTPDNNPTGPATGTFRVARGGSWLTDIASLRASYRNAFGPSLRGGAIGFRCAQTAP